MSTPGLSQPVATILRRLIVVCLGLTIVTYVSAVYSATPAIAQAGTGAFLADAEGAAGGEFNLAGSGFGAGATYTIRLLRDRTVFTLDDVTAGRNGQLGPTALALPDDLPAGPYELQAQNSLGGVDARATLIVREPVALELSPDSGAPGSTVQVSISNLAPGTLKLSVNDIAVIGPIPVRGTSYAGEFAIPQVAAGSATVRADNFVGRLRVGSAMTQLEVGQVPARQRYTVRDTSFESADLRPGDMVVLNGILDPPPGGKVADFLITPYWQDEDGQIIPLAEAGADLESSGALQVRGRLPNVLAGDATSAKRGGSLGVQIASPTNAGTQLFPGTDILTPLGSFKVTVVKDMPGSTEDGQPVPNLPAPGPGQPDPLDVNIEPLGAFTATIGQTLILSGTEPILDGDAVLNALTKNQAIDKGFKILDKFVNCIKLVDQQSELKWWEWVVDPYDTALLATGNAELFDPAFEVQSIVLEQQASAMDEGGTVQPAVVQQNDTTMLLIYRVTVDASLVQEGGQSGYGYVNELGFAVPTEVLFAWIPGYDLIFELDEEELTAVQVDNPAPIALPPLPPNWKSKLALKDIKVTGFHVPPYKKDLENPAFGPFYSFVRPGPGTLNPAITFLPVEPMRIEVYLSNFGYDATQVQPQVTIKLDGQPYTVSKEELPKEEEESASCYQSKVELPDDLEYSVWVASIPDPHTLSVDDHPLEVMVSDGVNTTDSTTGVISFQTYPDWFDDLPLANRVVEWGTGHTILSAISLQPNTAKTNVQDSVPEIGQPNSTVNVGSNFTCDLAPSGPGLFEQGGDMNSSALDNAAAPLGFDQEAYCSKSLPPVPPAPAAASTLAAQEAVVSSAVRPASTNSPDLTEKVTILDTGRIRVFEAKYGIPAIATVGVAVDFRVYATGVINATVSSGVAVDFDSGVEVDIIIEADILLGLASVDFGFSSDIGVAIPASFSWSGSINEPKKCFHYLLDLFYEVDVLWGAVNVADGDYNIFEGDKPPSCYNFASAAQAREVVFPALTGNPAIATDGLSQTLALWRSEAGNIVYSEFTGGAWSSPDTVAGNNKSGDPAVVFIAPNQAVAVWSQSGLSSEPAPGMSLSDILKMQHLAYATWDGSSWSQPQNLTTPTTGDGKVALAACPATKIGCPAGGEVTAVWVHNGEGSGDLAARSFRIHGATFSNGTWSSPQRIDDGDSDTDTEPTVAYVGNQALTVWMRDADKNAESVGDRQIAMHFPGGAVQTPISIPSGGAMNPSLAVDSQGNVQMAFTVVDENDRLVTNRRALHRAVGTCSGTTTCSWADQPIKDQANRTIFAEGPVVTVDGSDKVTLTFRAMGFESPTTPPPLAPKQEPIGVAYHTGELAQLELPASLTNNAVSPGYLTLDGAVNWRPAAIYIPQLDTNVAVAVKGQPPAQSTALAAALSAEQQATPIVEGQPIIFADTARLPNFAITNAQITGPQADGGYTLAATVLSTGLDWSGGTELPVEAYWDDSAWTDQPAGSASLSSLASSQAVDLSIDVGSPDLLPGADHTLYVVVNAGQQIAESTSSDNSVEIAVAGVQPPGQPRAYKVEGQRVAHLQWQASADPRILGYRVYRMAPGGSWQSAGTSGVAGWADFTVDWATEYQYRVHSFGLDLTESAGGDIVTVSTPAKPQATEPELEIYLPAMKHQ